ncbi:hypothetical protein P6694_004908 [Escherichia coli]|nr:hypothetical protein [Escherichia coli]
MKKQDLIQLKNTLSSLPVNTKQDLIAWLNDSLQMDTASVINSSQSELCCPHCHGEKVIRWGHSPVPGAGNRQRLHPVHGRGELVPDICQ